MVKIIPMLASQGLSSIILIQLDKKYSIVENIDSKVKLKIKMAQRDGFYSISSVVLNAFLVGFLFTIINVSDILSNIVSGVMLAIGIMFDALTKDS